ncbi:hypothetical protein HK100_009607, partial [Physocladia obscura]
MSSTIPGYYFDAERNRYFKILKTTHAPPESESSFVTQAFVAAKNKEASASSAATFSKDYRYSTNAKHTYPSGNKNHKKLLGNSNNGHKVSFHKTSSNRTQIPSSSNNITNSRWCGHSAQLSTFSLLRLRQQRSSFAFSSFRRIYWISKAHVFNSNYPLSPSCTLSLHHDLDTSTPVSIFD